MAKRVHQLAVVLALTAAGAGLVACGSSAGNGPASASPSPKAFTEAQSGQTVTAAVGDVITVTLRENPSTGYQWQMKVGPGLTVVSTRFTGPSPSPTPMVGAGGTRTWVIRVAAAGTFTLTGSYVRPWESSPKPAGVFVLTIAAT